ncbi:MAG TPA: carboxypeptidase-like regulatory domain-containing protein [Longimicrobium sp.]|nr:carboxypeptidase-like regulatory domain-containing protein [Longimicrobium sp.]
MRRLFFLTCLAAVAFAQPLSAQVHLDGIVVDDATRQPVAEARVELYNGWNQLIRARRTDSLGHFQIPIKRLGVYRVRVRGRDYPDVSQLVVTESYPYHSIEVRLRREGPLLAPITMLARAQSLPRPEMQGFHHRMRNGRGSFITRDDVEAVRPGYISDMLAWRPGVFVRRGGASGDDRLLIARRVVEGRLAECPLRVIVDGELVNSRSAAGEVAPASIDGMVDQTMVDGIEIYVNTDDVPPEFQNAPAGCGVVAVWTRSGGGATRRPSVDADN